MELIQGPLGELQPGPYVECPEEGCAYTLDGGVLMRHQRNVELVFDGRPPVAVDPELAALEHERPRLRLRRIVRMLAESAASARLASPYVVFVPEAGDLATTNILPGSGIVGVPRSGVDQVAICYEGALYGQTKMERLADRVFWAHGRLVADSPTVARMAIPRSALVEVGTFDPASGSIAPVDAASEAALAAWLGASELDPAELVCSGGTP